VSLGYAFVSGNPEACKVVHKYKAQRSLKLFLRFKKHIIKPAHCHSPGERSHSQDKGKEGSRCSARAQKTPIYDSADSSSETCSNLLDSLVVQSLDTPSTHKKTKSFTFAKGPLLNS
jgi:hypothetical protein